MANKSYKRTFLNMYLFFLSCANIEGAPKGSSIAVGIKHCSELESEGYTGYKCTEKSLCKNGHITINSLSQISVRTNASYSVTADDNIDLSKYTCQRQWLMKRGGENEYGDEYDEFYDEQEYEDQEMVCCRQPSSPEMGINHENSF